MQFSSSNEPSRACSHRMGDVGHLTPASSIFSCTVLASSKKLLQGKGLETIG